MAWSKTRAGPTCVWPNGGRNTLPTRPINNFDMSFAKKFTVREGQTLEFRGDFSNIFNHPQYGVKSISPFAPLPAGPAATVTTTAAGQFLQPQFGDGGGRVIRYLLKLRF